MAQFNKLLYHLGKFMRDQLKDLTEKDYWVYGITASDFDHSIELVREMIEARDEQYEKENLRPTVKYNG